ncbi:hypothetical protein AVEN_69179-1 [Araneus ventricosus]|uniref:Uncharacterized protein n=1 Tax=Araneus ventricosus TaxID=182803 RepID=A0A4Y2MQQ1_ARAVE|nr:hypothetical protein AVEN_69179-1 [Araneus ventricosus]
MEMQITALLLSLRRCTSSELENSCPLSKHFIRGKSYMRRDQGNRLVVEVPECDVLKENLAQSKQNMTSQRSVKQRTARSEAPNLWYAYRWGYAKEMGILENTVGNYGNKKTRGIEKVAEF